MAIHKKSVSKHHYLRHPVNEFKQFSKKTNKAVQDRKQQIIDRDEMPQYDQAGQMKMLVILLAILGAIAAVVWLLDKL